MAAYDQSTADSTVLLLRSKSGFFQWLATVRLSRVIAVLLVALIVVPLVTHHYLSQVGGAATVPDVHHTRLKLEASTVDESELLGSLNAGELRLRVDELLRIRASVSNELRDLESKRQKYMAEIGLYNQKIEELKSDVGKYQQELERFKLSVEQAKYAQREALKKSTPDIWAPQRILPSLEDASTAFVDSPARAQEIRCRMHSCFDHSRCSLTSGFPVYYYNPEDDGRPAELGIEATLKTSVTYALSVNPHITFDPNIACVFIVLLGSGGSSDDDDDDDDNGDGKDKNSATGNLKKARLESYLYSLAHWHGDGRNHVILHVDDGGSSSRDVLDLRRGRAMVAKTRFDDRQFRPGFDVVMPSIGISSQASFQNGEVWREMPAYSPARRHFLMTFQGELRNTYASETSIVESLKAIQRNGAEVTEDRFQLDFSCDQLIKTCGIAPSEWCVCGNTSTRARLLQNSTFSLILAPVDMSVSSTDLLNLRLREALRHGAVPVLLGDSVRFPYDEYVQWSRATIVLPKARITELHFLLRTVSDGDLFAARHQGRLLYERYLSTTQSVIDTFVSVLRTRLGIGPPPARDEPSPSVFNGSFVPLRLDVPMPDIDADESPVGPVEPPHPSPTFRRNFTAVLLNSYDMWNRRLDPFQAYPFSPHDPLLPSEAKFIGSALGFRPIGDGAGGAGKEFSEALGGNVPREQFTIVMLTYEREAILINSLQRLYGLPHLNKVIVVWNSPRSPSEDLRWPDIGIPIHVIRAKKNSLNNRFLPYDAIETEAVLSVDDDAHLRHDEIMFGFRVWREARDRIVGFPGRYHAWDTKHGGWLYNSNYSCELSMVLTGAAFFHKYYSYLYSNAMPQAIRDKVDEYMNCEDIAMNFLVSHLTRKPPLKVTSRWTFRCPGCPVALSEDDTHFHERHRCINFFVDVYGYMPLLNTQFRVDSVLFKTRLPHDKQKCFKFI